MQRFHVVKNLPVNADAVLGENLLIRYGDVIDYKDRVFRVSNKNVERQIPFDVRDRNNFTVPPRSEIICFIEIDHDEACVIKSAEIAKGIFVALTQLYNR